jgi:peptidoglycan hydrolase-like protein with peptidoglycan-binding domain
MMGRDADNRRLGREDIQEMQRLLSGRGFPTGDPDGVPGSRTREAIRAFQNSAGLPVDSHASATLLEHLRQEGPTARPIRGAGLRPLSRAGLHPARPPRGSRKHLGRPGVLLERAAPAPPHSVSASRASSLATASGLSHSMEPNSPSRIRPCLSST